MWDELSDEESGEFQELYQLMDEGDGDDDAHEKLVAKLTGKNKRRKVILEGKEEGEFNINSDKVSMHDLLETVAGESGFSDLRKNLEHIEHVAPRRRVEKAMKRKELARETRKVQYEVTAKDVSEWQPLVNQLQNEEHVSFPLKPIQAPTITTANLASISPETEMEREIERLMKCLYYNFINCSV